MSGNRLNVSELKHQQGTASTFGNYMNIEAKPSRVAQFFEHLFYQWVARPFLFCGRLGRRAMMGYADLGTTFDYIYRNVPVGYNRIGTFVDRFMFKLPSLQATLNRKEIISKILANEIKNNMLSQRKTRIVDLGSGTARYLIEVINSDNKEAVEGLCIDKEKGAVRLGKRIVEDRRVRYARGDVFRLGALKAFSRKRSWTPNVIVASGLFYYFSDDVVKRILKEIYDHLDEDGLVVFTSQMDNPSKKLMQKLGQTRDGTPWVLNYRDPEVIREWLVKMGFIAVMVSVDRWGMYTFCTGRKGSARKIGSN